YRPADSGRMHAYFLGHFLDHHRPETIDAFREEFHLPPHDCLADFHDRLFPLLDVLHELDRGGIALTNVITNFFGRPVIAIEHAAVLRVQAQLRYILVVHLDDVFVAVLGDINIRLHHARAGARIPLSRPRIEVLDHADGNLDMLYRPSQHLGDF